VLNFHQFESFTKFLVLHQVRDKVLKIQLIHLTFKIQVQKLAYFQKFNDIKCSILLKELMFLALNGQSISQQKMAQRFKRPFQ